MEANLPIKCLPVPYPPPEPEPDTLDESVDWMTYPHPELYRMVHEGLDLSGATSVSADWARLGDALGEIGDELHRIGKAFADAWQGDAADQARHALAALAGWAQDTGPRATEVSTLITLEVDNAMRARDAMPAPMVAEPGPGPRQPMPIPDSPHATVASSAFSDSGFGTANLLVNDQSAIVGPSHAAHQQAADTMERFQADSRDVYNTVPHFAAPKIGPKPPGRDNPPPQPTPPQQTPEGPPAGPGNPPSGPAPVGGPGIPSGGPGVPSGAPISTPAPSPAPRPAPPGAGTGEQNRPAAASTTRPGGGPAAMGGVPMGGMGAAQKPEDLERKSPAYLKEDEDLWGLEEHVVSPPVLGEDGPRRA